MHSVEPIEAIRSANSSGGNVGGEITPSLSTTICATTGSVVGIHPFTNGSGRHGTGEALCGSGHEA
eukprot:5681562-Prymnesium_polylepis.1